MPQPLHPDAASPPRLIDPKIPLPWLIGTAAAIVMTSAYVSFTVDRMREEVTELKVTNKSLLERFSSVAGDLALLKFRVETLEADKRAGTGSHK